MRAVIGIVFGITALSAAAVSLLFVMSDMWWIGQWGTVETTYFEWFCKLEGALAQVSGREFSYFWVWFLYLGMPASLLVMSWYFMFKYSEGYPTRRGSR